MDAAKIAGLWLLSAQSSAWANPFPDPRVVPVDPLWIAQAAVLPALDAAALRADARPVLRVQVDWDSASDAYSLGALEIEQSGTDALYAAAGRADPHGSFQARLVDPTTGDVLAQSAIGTGVAYKYLVRALTFRFPLPTAAVRFELTAENGQTGAMEPLVSETLDPSRFTPAPVAPNLDVRVVRAATTSPFVVLNVYSEGYPASGRDRFFADAQRVGTTMASASFPMLAQIEIRAVFAPSNTALGSARDLGRPIPERDSFLGLYFPYWYNFGRYYHVVYPTREQRYRRAIGSVPYDYPVVLIDDSQYWGVGNFKELTAVPAHHSSFSYLFLHEFGHYFGLNEEYEGGGPTELAFAPGIDEPWSQNITFQESRDGVKWNAHISDSTPVPTPGSIWRSGRYGAYEGGYADTPKPGAVYKPGFNCTMEAGSAFCNVCKAALEQRVRTDLGL